MKAISPLFIRFCLRRAVLRVGVQKVNADGIEGVKRANPKLTHWNDQ